MNTPSITPSHITRIAQQVADICQATGIPYTVVELQDCVVALINLYDVSASDEQAHALFAQLVITTSQAGKSWDWLTRELYFEVYVELMAGNRAAAAFAALRGESSLSDEALDRYHERLQRATSYSIRL